MRSITTLIGTAGNDPVHGTLPNGRAYANLRLAVNSGHWDRAREQWIEREASWYDVRAYGPLAAHLAASVAKGDPLVVHGELLVRGWQSGEKSGIAVELVAQAVGADLRFGTSHFTRSRRPAEGEPAGGDNESGGEGPWQVDIGPDDPDAVDAGPLEPAAAGTGEPPF